MSSKENTLDGRGIVSKVGGEGGDKQNRLSKTNIKSMYTKVYTLDNYLEIHRIGYLHA